MNFQAKLLPRSEIFRRWRKGSRVGGMISGVYFRWDGKDYVAQSIPEEFVTPIINNPMIVVSLATAPVGDVQPVEEPKPAPEPVPEPVAMPKVTITPPKRQK